MSGFPQFQYFLADHHHPVHPDDALWDSLLPLKRDPVCALDKKKIDGSITYGDYFSAIRFFLAQNSFEPLCNTASRLLIRRITPDHIKTITVILVKHGQFYHPALTIIKFSDSRLSFVINAAISKTGAGFIDREYASLKKLNTDFPYRFIPEVYFRGEGRTPANRPVKMFLGEWLEGYCEFHLSRKHSTKGVRMAVWAGPGRRFFLSTDQTFHLYRMAAMILTAYFNPETYRQIFPWHHAAGDFVVQTNGRRIDLKLVTVRRYETMFEENDAAGSENTDIQALPDVLLLFFLNMAVRTRLDRLDGVGEMAWSDRIAVEATRDGFFQGLDLMIKSYGIPDAFKDYMRRFFASQTVTVLYELSHKIISSYSPGAIAATMIQRHLKAHANDLHTLFNKN